MSARSAEPQADAATAVVEPGQPDVTLTRVFDAPRELVFEMWTQQEHVQQWWGPDGFSTTYETFDTRVGGEWIFVMHGPDGSDYPNRIVFEEIVPPERLVYSHSGGKDFPVDFHVTVTFEDLGGRTRLTMHSVFPTAAARDVVIEQYGAVEGGKQHLLRLGAHLAALRARPGAGARFH